MSITDDVIYLPPFITPAKPKEGQPCNGCGICCHFEICPVGMDFHNSESNIGPCPSMVFQDGRVRCGVVLSEIELDPILPDKMRGMIQRIIGIGKGCDCDAYDEELIE